MQSIGRLLGAFGWAGLIVWPLALYFSFDLLHSDLSRARGLAISQETLIGRDFVNVWEGGQLVAEGRVDDIYDRPAYRDRLKEDVGIGGIYAFSYPPHMLILAVPFGQLPYAAALLLWTLVGIALFWHAALPWLRDAGLPAWSVLLLPGSIVNVWAGHFGFLIGALTLYGWRLAESRPRLAGGAFALMTVKPHMGVLVPLILLLRRCWRTIGWAVAGTLLLVLVSLLLFGTDSWTRWFVSTLPFQASLIGGDDHFRAYLQMMPTVERALAPFAPPAAVMAGQIAAAFAATAMLVWAWRRGAATGDLGVLSIVAVFLILPYSFNYDMVAASLAVLVLAARWRRRLGLPAQAVFGAAFLVPLVNEPLADHDLAFSPLALLAMLVIAVRQMVRDARGAEARPERHFTPR